MTQIKYVALEGGGLKGIGHFGVFKFLIDTGLWDGVEMISGSSAGALAALVGSTGLSYEKMYEKFRSVDLEKMITTDSKFADTPLIGSAIETVTDPANIGHNLAHKFGMHKAKKLTQWVEALIKEITGIDNCTFEQWHNLRQTHLALKDDAREHPEKNIKYKEKFCKLKDFAVEACNLNTRMNEVFSWKTEHKDVSIAEAIRASCAFPFYMTSVPIKGNLYADGGTQKNCPWEIYEKPNHPGVPHKKLLCVMLEDKEEIEYFLENKKLKPKPINNIFDYTTAVLESITNVQSYDLVTSAYKDYSIFCDTKGISTFDFKALEGRENELIESGLNGAIAHFFARIPGFVEQYFSPEVIEKALSQAVMPVAAKSETFSHISMTTQTPQVTATPMPSITNAFNLSKEVANVQEKQAKEKKQAEQSVKAKSKVLALGI